MRRHFFVGRTATTPCYPATLQKKHFTPAMFGARMRVPHSPAWLGALRLTGPMPTEKTFPAAEQFMLPCAAITRLHRGAPDERSSGQRTSFILSIDRKEVWTADIALEGARSQSAASETHGTGRDA